MTGFFGVGGDLSLVQTTTDKLTKALSNDPSKGALVPLAPYFVSAALDNKPDDIPLYDFAATLAAICWRESRAGNVLVPPGASGVGDKKPRWKYSVPDYAKELSLWSGKTREGKKGTQYEILAPAYGGSAIRGWGYGLMQIDFVSHRDFLDSGKWQDPASNISEGASILADAYNSEKLETLEQAVAAYNAGVSAVASASDPDDVTTDGDYASDVMTTALNFGLDPKLYEVA